MIYIYISYIYIYIYICVYILYIYIIYIYIYIYIFILYIYMYILYIYIIAASNIVSSTAGLSLKYNNQMVRNSKPAIAYYANTESTSSNLKNPFFPAELLKRQ